MKKLYSNARRAFGVPNLDINKLFFGVHIIYRFTMYVAHFFLLVVLVMPCRCTWSFDNMQNKDNNNGQMHKHNKTNSTYICLFIFLRFFRVHYETNSIQGSGLCMFIDRYNIMCKMYNIIIHRVIGIV